MSASLEFKAKNVEKAVEIASLELNMAKEDLKYEVLSYGSSGIFGLSGTKKAKIRVQLPEDLQSKELKADRAESDVDYAGVTEKSKPSENIDPAGDDAITGVNPEGQALYSFPEDPMETGRLVLQRIVENIATDGKIDMEKNTDGVFFNVSGKNAGILIGKHGQTLNAIQCIVEKVVNKHNQNRIRVWVDIEGYLDTRRQNLEDKAIRLAEKVKRLGKPISLGQMNAYDRRIVHLALQDFSDVQTHSRGEGPRRKLVIFPKKRRSSAG
ncbi:MAG: RNA-binding cell elongation regulator Jag/EloR [Desulfobacterales bacterium]|jgi:spoIIIJ-associated protein